MRFACFLGLAVASTAAKTNFVIYFVDDMYVRPLPAPAARDSLLHLVLT